jgi:hypothetical protein
MFIFCINGTFQDLKLAGKYVLRLLTGGFNENKIGYDQGNKR